MNEITQYHDDDDDGYGGSLTSGRLIKGQLLSGTRPTAGLIATVCSRRKSCWRSQYPKHCNAGGIRSRSRPSPTNRFLTSTP